MIQHVPEKWITLYWETYTFCKYTIEGQSIFFARALWYVTNNMVATGTMHIHDDSVGIMYQPLQLLYTGTLKMWNP
jgi:hypothetical protein